MDPSDEHQTLHVHAIPARTLPIRSFQGILGNRTKDHASAAHAVGTGYRVVDEFLREGERAASAHWQPLGPDKQDTTTKQELGSAIGRVLDGLSDLGALGMQLAEALARPDPPECKADLRSAGPFDLERPVRSPRTGDAPLSLKLAIRSHRVVEINVKLDTTPATAQLVVTPLCDARGQLPSIVGISLARGTDSQGHALVEVRAELGPELASGSYHGVVLADGTPAGTLSLTC